MMAIIAPLGDGDAAVTPGSMVADTARALRDGDLTPAVSPEIVAVSYRRIASQIGLGDGDVPVPGTVESSRWRNLTAPRDWANEPHAPVALNDDDVGRANARW